MGRKWIPFDLDDFCGDHELNTCSLDTQGFMVHLMHVMSRSKPPGFLPQNPHETPLETLQKLMAFSPQTIRKHIAKLQGFGVLKKHEDGRWYSERMYRDWLKYRKNQEDGILGGNPALIPRGLTHEDNPGVNGGVNPNKNKNKNYIKEVVELADLLQEKIIKNKPDRKLSPSWHDSTADNIDKMIRLDNRDPAQIGKVIEWSQGNNFWWQNILSGAKLREKFDRLETAMGKEPHQADVPLDEDGNAMVNTPDGYKPQKEATDEGYRPDGTGLWRKDG